MSSHVEAYYPATSPMAAPRKLSWRVLPAEHDLLINCAISQHQHYSYALWNCCTPTRLSRLAGVCHFYRVERLFCASIAILVEQSVYVNNHGDRTDIAHVNKCTPGPEQAHRGPNAGSTK